jgi:hypothetical protein
MSEARHNDEVIIANINGFRELFEQQTKNVEKTLERIEAQVLKTNGRVTALEMTQAEVRGKAKVTGILWGGVSSVVISVIAFFINKQVT